MNQVVESSMEQIFCKVYTKATILVILLPDGDDSIAKHRQAPFFSSLLESWKCNLMWINFSRQQKQQYCSGHKTQDSWLLKLFFRFLHRQLSITDHKKCNQWMKKKYHNFVIYLLWVVTRTCMLDPARCCCVCQISRYSVAAAGAGLPLAEQNFKKFLNQQFK